MASTTGSLQVIKGDQPATVDRVQHDGDPLPSPADRAAPRDDALASRAVPTGDDEVAGNGHDGSRPPAAIDDANGPQSRARGGDYAAAALSPRLATAQGAAESDVVREQHALEQVANQLRTAIRQDPALADIADQFTVENTPEGLRIQITDQDRRPMFTLGSAAPTRPVRDLVQKIVPLLAGLPNAVSIAGHTDAATYRGLDMSNWELSVERANATRRLLVEGGLPDSRIRSVTGNADRDLLLPNDPLNAANRRIAIVLLRTSRAAAP
jgi:chemotaxis protein MotB